MTTAGQIGGAGGRNQINDTDKKVDAYKRARAARILKLDKFNKEKSRGNIQSWEDFRDDVDKNLKAAKKDLELSGTITGEKSVRIQNKKELIAKIGEKAYKNSFGVLNEGFSMAKKGGLTDNLINKIKSFINGSDSESVNSLESQGTIPGATSDASTTQSAASTSSSSTTQSSTVSTPASTKLQKTKEEAIKPTTKTDAQAKGATPNQTESPKQTNSDSNEHPDIDKMTPEAICKHAEYILDYKYKGDENVDKSSEGFKADHKFLIKAHELFSRDDFKSSISGNPGQYMKILGEFETHFELSPADNREMTKAEREKAAAKDILEGLVEKGFMVSKQITELNDLVNQLEALDKIENPDSNTKQSIEKIEESVDKKATDLYFHITADFGNYKSALQAFSVNGALHTEYEEFETKIGEQGLGKYKNEVNSYFERSEQRIKGRKDREIALEKQAIKNEINAAVSLFANSIMDAGGKLETALKDMRDQKGDEDDHRITASNNFDKLKSYLGLLKANVEKIDRSSDEKDETLKAINLATEKLTAEKMVQKYTFLKGNDGRESHDIPGILDLTNNTEYADVARHIKSIEIYTDFKSEINTVIPMNP